MSGGMLAAAAADAVPWASLVLRWLGNLPPVAVWMGLAIMVASGFVAGAYVSSIAARRARGRALDLRVAERHLARARQELASVEQAVADRTLEYAQVGQQIREASSLLALTQEQASAIGAELDKAIQRAKQATWLTVLMFIAGVVIGFITEWTADFLKPPFLP